MFAPRKPPKPLNTLKPQFKGRRGKIMNLNQVMKDIEGLSLKDMRSLVSSIKEKNVRRIDTSRRERKNAMTELYFKSVPALTRSWDFNKHSDHAESIREQVLSGVDL
mgnify:FL=1